MLPQPPPDAPAPPPSAAAILSQKKWKWLWIVGVTCVGVLGAAIAIPPMFIRRRGGCGQTEYVNNARQMGLALFEFETAYGKFPDPTTIAEVRKQTGTVLPLGTISSNDFFRQLIASGIAQSESMFYAKTSGVHKPDNVFAGAKALEKGECGYTYFLGAKVTDNPARPLIVAPMIPGTDRFDPKPFEGKAVVLKLDNSVTTFKIDKNGHAIASGGRNLMDPTNLIWDGHPPVIAWPDL